MGDVPTAVPICVHPLIDDGLVDDAAIANNSLRATIDAGIVTGWDVDGLPLELAEFITLGNAMW